ncbi:phage tail tube protein, partial [Salmonella enterica subsp. enterica serovar Montevideo]|nr:phage tail tube protein [Salmonella enterica subsp. enterica serovar Montevideo]
MLLRLEIPLTGTGNQRQGVAFIRVNGMELETMEGASFTPSGITREEVTGSRVYG